jgi:hypothetical protein
MIFYEGFANYYTLAAPKLIARSRRRELEQRGGLKKNATTPVAAAASGKLERANLAACEP